MSTVPISVRSFEAPVESPASIGVSSHKDPAHPDAPAAGFSNTLTAIFGDLPQLLPEHELPDCQEGSAWHAPVPLVVPVTPPPAPFSFCELDLSLLIDLEEAAPVGGASQPDPPSDAMSLGQATSLTTLLRGRPAAAAAPTPGSAPPAELSELAFEVRWASEVESPEPPLETAEKPKAEGIAPPVAPVLRVAAVSSEEPATPSPKIPGTAMLQAHMDHRPADPIRSTGESPVSTPVSTLASTRVKEARFDIEIGQRPASVREIAWNMRGPDNRTAYVRLAERSGEVVVTVRTPHQDLVQPLRSGLPELVQRLQSEGISVDARHSTSPSFEGGVSTRNSREHGTDLASGRGWQEHPDTSDRQRRHPAWRQAFEANEEE